MTYYLLSVSAGNHQNERSLEASTALGAGGGAIGIPESHRSTDPNRSGISQLVTPPRSNVTNPTSLQRPQQQQQQLRIPQTAPARHRTSSWESLVSSNDVDYDVVPRGTIYLQGCTVRENETLSRPQEHLYCWTIAPASSNSNNNNNNHNSLDSEIHLAARTFEHRQIWIEKILQVCQSTPTSISLPRLNITTEEVAVTDPTRNMNYEEELSSNLTPPLVDQEWKWSGDSQALVEHAPASLAQQLAQKFQTFTAVVDEINEYPDGMPQGSSSGGERWKPLLDRGDRLVAYSRTIDTPTINANQSTANTASSKIQATIVKSIALLDHPAKQVFSLLIDITRRQEFETNVRHCQRLKVVNSHTFHDYYVYNAVWPTKAREFTVTTHWGVVSKPSSGEQAIVILSFSSPEASSLQPVERNNIRAHLIVSMYLIRPMGDGQCHLSRLLCFDPSGGISRQLANVIVTQQAKLPGVLSEYLDRHETVPPNRLSGNDLTNENLVKDVISRLPELNTITTADHSVRRRLKYQPESADVAENEHAQILSVEKQRGGGDILRKPPGLGVQTMLILGPVLLYRFFLFVDTGMAFTLFLAAVFTCMRKLVMLHMGPMVSSSPRHQGDDLIGSTTCRFLVDLKGVLRYIANKKEEREELNRGVADVSVVHLVASAVAKALAREAGLRRRRVSMPLMMIDEYVDQSADPVSVSISEAAGGGIVTLLGVDRKGVQTIADEIDTASGDGKNEVPPTVGECLVLATPDYEQSEMEVDVASVHHSSVTVVAVIGGVRLDYGSRLPHSRSQRRTPSTTSARPVLHLSLTIRCPHQTDIVACRRFAEDVQKLLQFPEMCDD